MTENMSAFDFFALIVAIPLGLALIEIAQGLSVALRRRHEVRLGLFTPLLALFLILLTSNVWLQVWEAQDRVVISTPVLFSSLCLAMLYYITASFIFPDRSELKADLDEWFLKNRLLSLGGTFFLLLLLKMFLEVGFSSWPEQQSFSNKIGYVIGWSARPGIILVIIFGKRRSFILAALLLLNMLEIFALLTY